MDHPQERPAASPPPEQGATSEAHVPAQQPPARQASRVPPADVDPGGSPDHQGSSAARSQQAQRLIEGFGDRRTFDALRRRGVRRSAGPLTVVLLADDGAGSLRMAQAVGRRVGGAVVRNRIRRRLRAAAVELARTSGVPGGSCLVIVRPEAAGLGYAELRDRLDQGLRGAEERTKGFSR